MSSTHSASPTKCLCSPWVNCALLAAACGWSSRFVWNNFGGAKSKACAVLAHARFLLACTEQTQRNSLHVRVWQSCFTTNASCKFSTSLQFHPAQITTAIQAPQPPVERRSDSVPWTGAAGVPQTPAPVFSMEECRARSLTRVRRRPAVRHKPLNRERLGMIGVVQTRLKGSM